MSIKLITQNLEEPKSVFNSVINSQVINGFSLLPSPHTPHPTPYPHEKLFQQTLIKKRSQRLDSFSYMDDLAKTKPLVYEC
jgi:hypothetical protein